MQRSSELLEMHLPLDGVFFNSLRNWGIKAVDSNRRREAVSQFVQRHKNDPNSLLNTPRFDRVRIIEELAAQLNLGTEKGCCSVDDPTLEAPLPAPQHGKIDASTDARVAPFRHYCGSCHTKEIEPKFLAGDDAAVLNELKRRRPELLSVLAWDENPAIKMPPRLSTEYSELSQPEFENVHAVMLVILSQMEFPAKCGNQI